MVSVATLRTFEIVLIVSTTCLNSKQKPNENEVLNFTIDNGFVWIDSFDVPLDWFEDHYLWEYAPDIKEVEHLPFRENAL